MKRIAKATGVAFLLAGALVLAPSLPAQNQQENAFLTKARNVISPSLAGPHHLEAQVTVSLSGGKKGKGTYTLDWAAPDRFREEIHLVDYDEVKIASGSTLYRKRSVDYIPERVFELEELMNPTGALDEFQRGISRLMADNVSKAKSGDKMVATQLTETKGEFGRADAVCVSLPSAVPEVCVDASHYWPLQITEDDVEMEEDLLFEDYKRLKDAHIPRERRFVENGAVGVEARVKKLEAVQGFDTAVFTPPAGADQIPWCFNMVPAVRLPIKAPAAISVDDFPEPEFLYGLVRADGTVQKISIIGTSGAKADAGIRTIADSIRFTPATCGGKPIESETRFTISGSDLVSPVYDGGVVEAGKNGYTVPSCAYCPTPPFSDAAYRLKIQGIVVLDAIIGADGRAHNIRITKTVGYGLDEAALRSVRKIWRFKPAAGPDGKPAAVHLLIEVDFNIY